MVEFDEEVAELEALKKETLKTIVALGLQHTLIWTESLETLQELQTVSNRQIQRVREGFIANGHPHNKPVFHFLNQQEQLEQRQKFRWLEGIHVRKIVSIEFKVI